MCQNLYVFYLHGNLESEQQNYIFFINTFMYLLLKLNLLLNTIVIYALNILQVFIL